MRRRPRRPAARSIARVTEGSRVRRGADAAARDPAEPRTLRGVRATTPRKVTAVATGAAVTEIAVRDASGRSCCALRPSMWGRAGGGCFDQSQARDSAMRGRTARSGSAWAYPDYEGSGDVGEEAGLVYLAHHELRPGEARLRHGAEPGLLCGAVEGPGHFEAGLHGFGKEVVVPPGVVAVCNSFDDQRLGVGGFVVP